METCWYLQMSGLSELCTLKTCVAVSVECDLVTRNRVALGKTSEILRFHPSSRSDKGVNPGDGKVIKM